MPGQTLLDINSDELFEKHTIPEIKAVELEINNEIGKKKEELRTMVGEKCRDLLNAADTITEMKKTTENFMVAINHAKQLCLVLQEKKNTSQLSTITPPTSSVKLSEDISKVIEIKILLILPEQIWTALERKEFLLCAELYLFATHLHLSLEFCSNSKKIMNNYPIIKKHWEIISGCKQVISDGACKELGEVKISHQEATKFLGSLIFLELWSYEKLLHHFLKIRMTALNGILKSEELSRKKLRQCVELLQQTLVIVMTCFLDKPHEKCSLQTLLDSITGNREKPLLSKIVEISSLPRQYLSSLILNFQPKIPNELQALSQNLIKNIMCNWLENVEQLLSAEITKILLLIDDIKRLHKVIKQEVLEVNYPQNWKEIIESLTGLNDLNIYNKFIKNFVTHRVKELVQIKWDKSLNEILLYLKEMDENIMKDRGKFSENNIRWFIWKDNKLEAEDNLKLKTLGYTPRIKELCQKLDLFLMQLLDDLMLYIGKDSLLKSKGDENSDVNIILTFLNEYSLKMVQRLTQHIIDSCKGEEINESQIIIRARFLTALTSQSPSLQNCLRLSLHSEENFSRSETNNIWQQAIICLSEGSFQMWQFWRVLMSSKFRRSIKSKLKLNISLGNLLKSKLISEIITIEEQTEDGTNIKSELRIPSQPSLFLQDLLFQICHQLNAVAPHTLPRQIHQDLVDASVKDILEHYQDWSSSNIIYQSQAWQMLLDVKFLILLLVSNENKELSKNICETLEKTIDPFDLNVYFPHLQNSVKKSTIKLQGTFGVLVNFNDKLPVFNGLKLSQNSADSKIEEPNLMAISNSVPWFPLLPVTNLGVRKQETSRFDTSDPYSSNELSSNRGSFKGKEKDMRKESGKSDFFKSAGAFFDAMTGGWT